MKRYFCLSFIIIFLISSSSSAKTIQNDSVQIAFHFSKTLTTTGDQREKAVAFHSLTFIDSIANSLDQITFGSSEANSLQGDGWFENESSPDVGSMQWAGSAQKKATMQLSIPEGTEGLLLKINSVEDSLWMTVTIDQDTAAVLLVDAYWHSGYVPIGDAVPESTPNAEPEWIDGRYFPHFPSTNSIYSIKLHTTFGTEYGDLWNSDWRMNQSMDNMLALTLVGMQGIINRSGPRVYLDWDDPWDYSSFWPPVLEQHVNVVYLDLDGLSAVNFLLRRFGNRFAGSVVYDPEVPETINLATMIAGLEDRIILAPEQLELPGIPDFASVNDLRQMVQQYNWDASIESQTDIYQWVYDNLWPNLEHRIIGMISPGPPTSREVDNGCWPIEMASRDYLVALKIPALYLHPVDTPQVELLTKYLEDAPSPIPVTGVFALYEPGTLEIISKHGDWMAGISWPGAILSCAGLTVFSGIRPDLVPLPNEIDNDKIIASLGGRPVATMFTTDGDPIFYSFQRGFQENFAWQDVQGQKFAWTISPLLADVAPAMWNDYMSNRSQVTLACAVSGAGYMLPWLMNEAQIDDFLDYTSLYLEETGLRVVHIFEGENRYFWPDFYAAKYYDHLKDSGYLGAIFGYGPQNQSGLGFYYGGVPTPTVVNTYRLNTSSLNRIVENLSAKKSGEEIFDIKNPASPDCHYVSDADAMNGMAVYIPKDYLNAPSYSMAVVVGSMTLAPGHYEARFRMKVAENINNKPIARISVGTSKADWNLIGNKNISPNEFAQAGQYEEHIMEFILDSITTDIEFLVDYGDGATDLYVDYLHIVCKDGQNHPNVTTIVIDNINVNDPDLTILPRQFTQEFESNGGIVLSPDECLASLNPVYMIELAKTYLGTGHQSIIKATQELNENKFFQSLLTVRNALSVQLDVESDFYQPTNIEVFQNYPNPFNPSTTIRFLLPQKEHVKIEIYNLLGQKIELLLNKKLPAGMHYIEFYSKNLPTGLYIYKISSDQQIQTQKMLLLR